MCFVCNNKQPLFPHKTHPQVQHNVDLLLKRLTSVGRDIPDTKVVGHKFSTSDRILRSTQQRFSSPEWFQSPTFLILYILQEWVRTPTTSMMKRKYTSTGHRITTLLFSCHSYPNVLPRQTYVELCKSNTNSTENFHSRIM